MLHVCLHIIHIFMYTGKSCFMGQFDGFLYQKQRLISHLKQSSYMRARPHCVCVRVHVTHFVVHLQFRGSQVGSFCDSFRHLRGSLPYTRSSKLLNIKTCSPLKPWGANVNYSSNTREHIPPSKQPTNSHTHTLHSLMCPCSSGPFLMVCVWLVNNTFTKAHEFL